MFKVFVSDNLSKAAVEFLKKNTDIDVTVETGLSEDDLAAKIGDYDALLVRSATKVTKKIIDAGTKLRLIGRAGAGVDNVDIPAASARGILVVNAPFGNLTSVAELVFCHLLAWARNIPFADSTMKAGKWEKKILEKNGRELDGKTIGIIGLGKIGQLVAKRAAGFNLKVVAYDPVTTPEVAASVGARLADLETVLKEADFVTLHVPLIPQTKHLISAKQLKLMKPTAVLVNCARGGVVDDAALAEALKDGTIGAAGLDCFEKEPVPADSPFLTLPNVTLTPHIGGATEEAQEKVGLELVDQIARALRGELVEHVVNLPFRAGSGLPDQKAWNQLAETLARLAAQILGGATVQKAELTAAGEIGTRDTKLVQISTLKGLLESLSGEQNVNFINASDLAEKKGLKLTVKAAEDAGHFKSALTLTLATTKETVEVRGTVVSGQPRITSIQDFQLEFAPGKRHLITRHKDAPGIIGKVGTILGNRGINIANMELGRKSKGEPALMVVEIDEVGDRAFLKELEALAEMERVVLAEF